LKETHQLIERFLFLNGDPQHHSDIEECFYQLVDRFVAVFSSVAAALEDLLFLTSTAIRSAWLAGVVAG
jgi:hypothetical protein